MDLLMSLMLGSVSQADALLMESRQLIGLAAAILAAMLAAHLGWHGTDRVIAWRGRSEED
ncbi:hypothetical protein [Actinomadura decatromicini]|uniref:Uncharacterized protein n=1 Tax=Actinomadura decatromicini TaxID=2604572 RepID=A0A5D3F6C2_9ACTN|nr:hypothetical protein [Actinomadura decatromicini]TYK43220.1 hypothetical protein FXF68_39035 [Actinomadura decatromicini]